MPNSSMQDMQELNPLSLPLHGRHLIEASAGTGKTFNITRLYVRLLVEKQLSVQQILVMTFTDAATEEIRSRVAAFIDEVLSDWDKGSSEFIAHLHTVVNKALGRRLLESAKLSIDEASIFTIHGFCQRVIKQFSSTLGLDPQSNIQPELRAEYLQAIADAIIALDKSGKDFEALRSNKWHTPEALYQGMQDVLYHQGKVTVLNEEQIWQDAVASINAHWAERETLRRKLIEDLNPCPEWYEGLAKNAKNEARIAQELAQARDSLSASLCIDEVQSQDAFEEAKKNGFKCNYLKLLLPPSLEILFSGTRTKKYPQDWFADINKRYTQMLEPIKKPLKDKTKQGLTGRLQLSQVLHVAFAIVSKVKTALRQQMQQDALLSYDDLIRIVAEGLNSDKGQSIAAQLVQQFPAALVDEFQDTDEQQYSIFSKLYPKADKNSTLVMIGDPKQAIYGFRGGDVFTYLQARDAADYLWSMDTNWRSTAAMVGAYNFVFDDPTHPAPDGREQQSVFDYAIEYQHVMAAQGDKTDASELNFAEDRHQQALHLVCSDAFATIKESKNRKPYLVLSDADQQRYQLMQWMTAEITMLLNDATINEVERVIDENGIEKKHTCSRRVEPQDIAILVRAGFEAKLIKDYLQSQGLASVYLSEKSPLFSSEQAQHLYYVLDAIWTGNDQRKCITALATGLFYRAQDNSVDTPTLIAQRAHPHWQFVYKHNARCRQLWQEQGVYALLSDLIKHALLVDLHGAKAERVLTNYQHLAELMAQAAVERSTPTAQLMWLSRHINQLEEAETAQLRLESDQALIKIVTQHKSKGLEYPIVFVPFANTARQQSNSAILKYHDADKALVMQLGNTDFAQREANREAQAEDMRLLYVALTRPVFRAYLGMLATENASQSAIHRALGIAKFEMPSEELSPDTNYGEVLMEHIKHATAAKSAFINVQMASNAHSAESTVQDNKSTSINVQKLSRKIVQSYELSSFTGLSRKMHLAERAEEIDSGLSFLGRESEVLDEDLDGSKATVSNNDKEANLLQFTLKKGADTGNVLHDTLEFLNFKHPDFAAVFEKVAQRHPLFNTIDVNQYQQWIESCLSAHLAPAEDNQEALKLTNIAQDACIKEPEFYFPMEHASSLLLSKILQAHRTRIATQHNFAAIPVGRLKASTINGMLHGFIDLIFSHGGQYYVCDYKSTFLGLQHADYTPKTLAQNIQEHDYDLQYLLYSLALQRFLKQRVPDYSLEAHFGGVYYLYLRGMSDSIAETINGISPGVYFTDILRSEINQLDALFTGDTEYQTERENDLG